MPEHRVDGQSLDGGEYGGVRLEDPENPDAWIEARFTEDWWRALLYRDENPVDPYFLKCQGCHRHQSPVRWGKGSAYCPVCEQKRYHAIRKFFENAPNFVNRAWRSLDERL